MPIRIVLLALAFALATAAFGWWTVPLLGAVWGWIAPRDSRAVLTASGAAALGWTILLVWTATRGPLVALAGKVGGIMSLPGWTLMVLTVVFAVMLAGSAAGVGKGLRNLRNKGAAVCGLLLFTLPSTILAQSDVASAVRSEVERFVATVNAGDALALADLYARRPGVSSLGDGEITVGWSNIRDLLTQFIEAGDSVTMQADSIVVASVGERGAVAVFRYRWDIERGSEVTSYYGAMTIVYERTGREWRVVHDHSSSLVETAISSGGPTTSVRETVPCTISRVVDGDTIECVGRLRVRLIGMDTPELSQRPFGVQAADALSALIPVGSEVQLERDVELNDRYDRRLAYIWHDRIMVNWQMVREGWAVLLTYPPNVQYVEYFTEAQRVAREEGVGLWAVQAFDCLPRDRRRGRCE